MYFQVAFELNMHKITWHHSDDIKNGMRVNACCHVVTPTLVMNCVFVTAADPFGFVRGNVAQCLRWARYAAADRGTYEQWRWGKNDDVLRIPVVAPASHCQHIDLTAGPQLFLNPTNSAAASVSADTINSHARNGTGDLIPGKINSMPPGSWNLRRVAPNDVPSAASPVGPWSTSPMPTTSCDVLSTTPTSQMTSRADLECGGGVSIMA